MFLNPKPHPSFSFCKRKQNKKVLFFKKKKGLGKPMAILTNGELGHVYFG
jgi:hypothetical protein